jgi:hypothetical protein
MYRGRVVADGSARSCVKRTPPAARSPSFEDVFVEPVG